MKRLLFISCMLMMIAGCTSNVPDVIGPDVSVYALDSDYELKNTLLVSASDVISETNDLGHVQWISDHDNNGVGTSNAISIVTDGDRTAARVDYYIGYHSGFCYSTIRLQFQENDGTTSSNDIWSQGNALMFDLKGDVRMATNTIHIQFQVPNPTYASEYYDVYYYNIDGVTQKWKTYIIPFEDFVQDGYSGSIRTLEEDLSRVENIEFNVNQNVAVDGESGTYYIDDVYIVTYQQKK